MCINKKKEKYDLSDHNTLSSFLKLNYERCKYRYEIEEFTYVKIHDGLIDRYFKELENSLSTRDVRDTESNLR